MSFNVLSFLPANPAAARASPTATMEPACREGKMVQKTKCCVDTVFDNWHTKLRHNAKPNFTNYTGTLDTFIFCLVFNHDNVKLVARSNRSNKP